MGIKKSTSSEFVPILKYKVQEAMTSPKTDNRFFPPTLPPAPNTENFKESSIHQLYQTPQLPDFTKRPKIMPTGSSSVDDYFVTETEINSNSNNTNTENNLDPPIYDYMPYGNHLESNIIISGDNNNSNNNNNNNNTINDNKEKHPFYSVSNSDQHSRNASVSFFSDGLTDEHTYNELPLNELLDDFEYDDIESNMELNEESETNQTENNNDDFYSVSRTQTPDPYYSSIGNNIDRSQSPFLQKEKIEYTQEIPSFYDPTKLKYPYKSPLDYTDEEFERMNHFEFLKELNFSVPPLLPVYLNSNLLNDSSNKNYKTFPYQYQESPVPHVNEIYKYRINELNVMDKYSTHKIPSRPPLNRSTSSNSSNSSLQVQRNNKNGTSKLVNKARLLRENSNGKSSKLKHADKINLIERNLIPHHVMLNHLITCNLNKDGYITSSCITRYKGKFITQIMYFSNELEKL
jgi:hypothetical protein